MVQLKKQYVRYIIAAVILAAAVLWVIRLNSITRTQLINRTGQSFETGVVVRILQDNIQEDGMRIGQQTVVVRMTSGEKKGEELTTTSSAGYLFGAACTVGMRVVVMQSIAGDSVITSVYSMDRKEVIIGFAVLYLGTLCVIGGKKGSGTIAFYVGSLYMCGNSGGHSVPDRRGWEKDGVRHGRDFGGRCDSRGSCRHIFQTFRHYGMECVGY